MNFTTILELNQVSFYGMRDTEDVESCRLTVKWSVELETREWGIKDFYVTIDDISGEYDVLVTDEHDDGGTETRTFDFEPFKENLTKEVKFDEYGQLQINDLYIDFGTKGLEVRS